MLAVRPLLQGYLSTALERWWLAKNSRSKQKSRKNNAFVTTSLINNTSALLPRVVQQLVAPACMCVHRPVLRMFVHSTHVNTMIGCYIVQS